MRWLLALLALTWGSEVAHAQTVSNKLRGISEMTLLIETLDDASKACGVTNDTLRDGFMFPASSAGFRMTDAIAAPTVYLQLTTINSPSRGCIHAIVMQAYVHQSVRLEYTGRVTRAPVELWSKSWIGAGPVSGSSRLVRDAIEMLTKKFVTDWNLDNRS